MVKPFEMIELILRIENILKRRQMHETVICIKDVVIEPEKRLVTKAGREVYLKPLEFDCLMC